MVLIKSLYNFVKPYLNKQKGKIVLIGFLDLCLSVIVLSFPVLNGKIIDLLITGNNFSSLYNLILLFVLLSIFDIILGFYLDRLIVKVKSIISFDINSGIRKHLQTIRLYQYLTYNPLYLSDRIGIDSTTMASLSVNSIIGIIKNFFVLLGAIVILLNYDWVLGLFIITIAPIYYFLYASSKKKLFKNNIALKERQSRLVSAINEHLENIRFVKINSLENYFIVRVQKVFHKSFKQVLNYQKVSYQFTSLDKIVGIIINIGVLLYVGTSVINGRISIGKYTVIYSFFSTALSCIKYFFGLGKSFQEGLVAHHRIMSLLNLQQEYNGNIQIKRISSIKCNHLSLRLGEKKLFSEMSFSFIKGFIYLIKGSNGVGKTSLINALLGLFSDLYTGQILYNDMNIKNLDMWGVRNELISVLDQNPVIIEDSLLSNATIGLDDFNEHYYDYLCRLMGFSKSEDLLNKEIEHIITKNASNISGGEKQKIAIIRALLKVEAEFLILDEPSSALDEVSRENLKSHLKTIKNKKIILIISHDSSMFEIADQVIDLNIYK